MYVKQIGSITLTREKGDIIENGLMLQSISTHSKRRRKVKHLYPEAANVSFPWTSTRQLQTEVTKTLPLVDVSTRSINPATQWDSGLFDGYEKSWAPSGFEFEHFNENFGKSVSANPERIRNQ